MDARRAPKALTAATVAGVLALATATAALAADPFTPRPPQPPRVDVRPPQPSFDALAANATYIGTINGVSVYVQSTTGCYLYREKDRWRDSTCVDLARNGLHHAAKQAARH